MLDLAGHVQDKTVANLIITDIVGLLGSELPHDADDQRTIYQKRDNQNNLSQHITHGTMDSDVDEIRAVWERSPWFAPRSQLALAEDVLIAKEIAYGLGSTPSSEVAGIFGWGSRLHQQQELNNKERERILAESTYPAELPWDDPEWYRDIARRFGIDEISIPDKPNIQLVPTNTSGHDNAAAWAIGGSAQNGDPDIKIAYDKIWGMTRGEIENTLAHEMVHTILPVDAGHGPEFARYADMRNIGMYAMKTDIGLIEPGSGDTIIPTHGIDRVGGQVFVHNVASVPMEATMLGRNNAPPTTWNRPRIYLLSNPDDIEPNQSFGYRLGSNYYTPGAALMRHWPAIGPRPDFWEIGTVEQFGTVQWDCLTYTEPSREAIKDYVLNGYCLPELRQDEVQPTREEYEDLIRRRGHYILDEDSPISHKMRVRLIDKAFSDPTLTAKERKHLEKWVRETSLREREKFAEAAEQGGAAAGAYTRRLNRERDRIIEERSPELVQGLVSRRERHLAAPDRPIYTGGVYGFDPTREITFSDPAPEGYRQTMYPYDDPRIDDDSEQMVAEAVKSYKDANVVTPAVGNRGLEYRGAGQQTGYRPRSGRGRLQ